MKGETYCEKSLGLDAGAKAHQKKKKKEQPTSKVHCTKSIGGKKEKTENQ